VMIVCSSNVNAGEKLYFPVFSQCRQLVMNYQSEYADYKQHMSYEYVSNEAKNASYFFPSETLIVRIKSESPILKKTVIAHFNSIYARCIPETTISLDYQGGLKISEINSLVDDLGGDSDKEVVVLIKDKGIKILFSRQKRMNRLKNYNSN
jgi:hypothetical protein